MKPIANLIRTHGFAASLANGALIPFIDDIVGNFDKQGLDTFDKINLMIEAGKTNDEIADWLESEVVSQLQFAVYGG